jgi:hypothetical protein
MDNLISFIGDLVNNSTSVETLKNFKSAMDHINGLSSMVDDVEVTDEGALSFSIFSNGNILKSAIGDKYYFIIVSSPTKILKNEVHSVSEGFDVLKYEISKL